jgi:hypothetical protein
MPHGNEATRIGGKGGPSPGAKLGRREVSERRIKSLQREHRRRQELFAALPGFEGDGLAKLQSIYRDPTVPIELQIVAARAALPFERAAYQAKPESDRMIEGVAIRDAAYAVQMRALGWSPGSERSKALSEPEQPEKQRSEWLALLAEAGARGVPEHEIARFREQFRQAFPNE